MTTPAPPELPDFLKADRRANYFATETVVPAPPSKKSKTKLSLAEKLVLIVTTATLTFGSTYLWALLMNGKHNLPSLRIMLYVPESGN